MGVLADLVDAGKIRFIGVSNFSMEQLRVAQKTLTKYPIVSNQVRYNFIDRTIEKDLLPYCQTNHVTVIAYCPLARGLDRVRDCDPTGVIDELARMTGKSPAQIVVNWCVCKDGVVAFESGSTRAHRFENRISQEKPLRHAGQAMDAWLPPVVGGRYLKRITKDGTPAAPLRLWHESSDRQIRGPA
jgi:diketogulonate reductase-like aldo/keto reductase